MSAKYKAVITAHDPDNFEVIGSMLIAKSSDRLTVEKFIERHAEDDADAFRFKRLFPSHVVFKVSMEYPDGVNAKSDAGLAFNVASVAFSNAKARLDQLERILRKEGVLK